MRVASVVLLLAAMLLAANAFRTMRIQLVGRSALRSETPLSPNVQAPCGMAHGGVRVCLDATSPSLYPQGQSQLVRINKLYYRSSWIAWWVQIILTTVSGVILTFANAVRPAATRASYLWISGFAFSSVGVITALVNAFWTWNVTRLCRRITRQKMEESRAVGLLRRYAQIAIIISVVGTFFALLGAEQIVGTLASKILSAGGYVTANTPLSSAYAVTPIQAVDIFLVQANTNSLLAHFAALVCYLLLLTRLPPRHSSSSGGGGGGGGAANPSRPTSPPPSPLFPRDASK